MEGTLRVTPEKLISAATEFSACGNTVSSLTQQMMTMVNGLSSVWSSETAAKYNTKFSALQSDIDKMNRMIQEYVTDLNDMARNYQDAETYGDERTASLATDVIV